MKAADLDRAQSLSRDLAATRKLAGRVAGEALRLSVGDERPQEVELSPAYAARLRADIARGLELREADLVAQLAVLGVEP